MFIAGFGLYKNDWGRSACEPRASSFRDSGSQGLRTAPAALAIDVLVVVLLVVASDGEDDETGCCVFVGHDWIWLDPGTVTTVPFRLLHELERSFAAACPNLRQLRKDQGTCRPETRQG